MAGRIPGPPSDEEAPPITQLPKASHADRVSVEPDCEKLAELHCEHGSTVTSYNDSVKLTDRDGPSVLMRPKPWSPCLLTSPNGSGHSIPSSESCDWVRSSSLRPAHDWSPDSNYVNAAFQWNSFGARPKNTPTSKTVNEDLKTTAGSELPDSYHKERIDNWRRAGEALKMALTNNQLEDFSIPHCGSNSDELSSQEGLQSELHKTRTSLASRALEIVRKRQHLTPEALWPSSFHSGTVSNDKHLPHVNNEKSSPVILLDAIRSCDSLPKCDCGDKRLCHCGLSYLDSCKRDTMVCGNALSYSSRSSSGEDLREVRHKKPHKKKLPSDKKLTNNQGTQLASECNMLTVPNGVSELGFTLGIESIHLSDSLNNSSLCVTDIVNVCQQSDCTPVSHDSCCDTADSGECSDEESGVEGECWQEVSNQLTERLYCFRVGGVVNRESDTTSENILSSRLLDNLELPSLVASSSSSESLVNRQCSSCASSKCSSTEDLPALSGCADEMKYPSGEESAELGSEDESRKGSPSSSSSNEAYADDEFECDCVHCLENNRQYTASWMNDESYSQDSEELGQINDLFPWHFSDYDPRLIDLSAMFQAVILQMLSVHPDLLDQAPPPATPTAINNLPTQIIDETQMVAELCCPICLCPYELNEQVSRLPCQHKFHPLCIKAWLVKSGTCPVCRFTLTG